MAHRHHQKWGGSAWANPTNEDAAECMANGHPKCNPPSLHDSAQVLPGSPGSGAAPGANGPPTTGSVGPGGPLGST